VRIRAAAFRASAPLDHFHAGKRWRCSTCPETIPQRHHPMLVIQKQARQTPLMRQNAPCDCGKYCAPHRERSTRCRAELFRQMADGPFPSTACNCNTWPGLKSGMPAGWANVGLPPARATAKSWLAIPRQIHPRWAGMPVNAERRQHSASESAASALVMKFFPCDRSPAASR